MIVEVRIEKPFRLHLDVTETDKRVPSVRVRVAIEVQQFGHIFEYHGSFWFDCSFLHEFAADLNGIDTKEACFVDMEGCFALRLRAISEKLEISCEIKKVALTGVVATAAFLSPIDEDTFSHIRRQFAQFESWWD
ncbi:hypothetical protein [Ralstonia solanacearum]|uniref:hypothetical protein n=1 Tax=Ralstonia solanacearum TaxID=305 RepID=UPI000F608FBA|nr:hypothetical protein [Ralstonia solanacearum]